tara:strand:- start:353 stop:940 length:588 start_codon:yes stop_codon:yes gene_type:complete
MNRLKGIKRLVSYGVTTLITLNLFIGCEQSNPFGSVVEYEDGINELSPVVFELDSRLEVDANGYYHLKIDTSNWQTLHRISGHVYRDDNPVNIIKFAWASSHHWIVGDDFGYVIANTGLNDHGTYVGYDTTYVTWFGGSEVPIVNGSSYSREDGEVNTMIAPVKTMIGDTATISYGYFDNWREEETYGNFNIIFD